jgi:hypothetical protein
MDAMKRSCAVVLGMHRSGTSALAGVLKQMGVDFGRDLMGARPSNPKGHFELNPAVKFNDFILRHFQSRWDRSFQLPQHWASDLSSSLEAFISTMPVPSGNPWGIKDPRMCRLVPVWKEIFNSLQTVPCFILCIRDPREVALSLQKRNGLPLARGKALWLEHFCGAEANTRGCRRLFLSYSALLEDFPKTVNCLAAFLNLLPPTEDCLAEIGRFLDPTLRHHREVKECVSYEKSVSNRLYSCAKSENEEELATLVDNIGKAPPLAFPQETGPERL